MKIMFSDHADEQMHKRGISRDAVLNVVRNGQRVWMAFRGRSLHYNKRVVAVTTPDVIDEDGVLVVTVYKRKHYKKSTIERWRIMTQSELFALPPSRRRLTKRERALTYRLLRWYLYRDAPEPRGDAL